MATTHNARLRGHDDVALASSATRTVDARRFFNDDLSSVVFWPRRRASRTRLAQGERSARTTSRRSSSEP